MIFTNGGIFDEDEVLAIVPNSTHEDSVYVTFKNGDTEVFYDTTLNDIKDEYKRIYGEINNG